MTLISLSSYRTGIMKISFDCSPVGCRGQNLDVVIHFLWIVFFQKVKSQNGLNWKAFHWKIPTEQWHCGPMVVPSVFDRKPCFVNMKRFISCTIWSVVTMKPVLQYFGITPRLWPLGVESWHCVGFFVNNFSLDDFAEMWSGAKLVLN